MAALISSILSIVQYKRWLLSVPIATAGLWASAWRQVGKFIARSNAPFATKLCVAISILSVLKAE
jgi:hypothetical protein